MKRSLELGLFVLVFALSTGCHETYRDPYESSEVRKARDAAAIKNIANQSKIEDAEQRIMLLAAEKNILLSPADRTDIMKRNYQAVDSLLKKLRGKLAKSAPILVASFVNLDNLSESSTFGRVVSEQMASRFKQKDYTTIEMKLRTALFMKQGSGEFMLSRELAQIGTKHRAQAVVVGTYATGRDRVYLTARVINVADSKILSSYDYEIRMTHDVFKMLLKDKVGPDWL